LGIVIVSQKGFWRSAIFAVLIACTLLPVLYLFVMIQYGAITLPYWDHVVTAKYIIKYLDGTLTFHDLVETQSQARPLFPRLIFIANAILTDWDIRSEYIYIYLTVYGALVALWFALRHLSNDWPKLAVLTTSALISVLACSPVGSMNHYWSLMLLATLCYFCLIVALLAVSIYPSSWTANILAAILAWVATYSLSQGLFLFPTIFLLHQLIAPRLLVLTRWSIFWLANLVVCCAVYFPGSDAGLGLPPTPTLLHFLAFIAVYIGNPLGSLLWFPRMGAIDLPHTTIINGICGVILLALSGFTAYRALRELSARRPETLLFFSFALYAAACTTITAFGRASGDYPVMSANSSRYSIYAAILFFGLIFYYAPRFARGELAFTGWHKAAFSIFILASAVSYVRAFPVYKTAHNDNAWLADVYGPHAEPTDLDSRAYPDFDYFNPKRADMLRLGIGPYRSVSAATAQIYSGAFVAAVRLVPGTIVKQRFQSLYPLIQSITFPIVTWAKSPSSYRIQWRIVGLKDNSVIGEGSFATSGLMDWQTVTLRLDHPSEEREVEATFSVKDGENVQNAIGLALYPAGVDPVGPAVIDGHAREDGSKVGLRVRYLGSR
jgi:hypothetical protein